MQQSTKELYLYQAREIIKDALFKQGIILKESAVSDDVLLEIGENYYQKRSAEELV